MTQPNYTAYAEQKSGTSATIGDRKPRRTKGPTAVALAALAFCYAMCWRPAWDGTQIHAMTAGQQGEALTVPPDMVSEEKRQAIVVKMQLQLRELIAALEPVAGEDSPAGEAARRALEKAREAIDAALPVPPEGR